MTKGGLVMSPRAFPRRSYGQLFRWEILALFLTAAVAWLALSHLHIGGNPWGNGAPGKFAAHPNAFIYVYDLPERFNQGLLEENPHLMRLAGQYATGSEIHRIIRCDLSQRTLDPSTASLFFLPIYADLYLLKQRHAGSSAEEASTATSHFISEAVEHVKSHFPFWSRSDGSDHFLVLSGNGGRCVPSPDQSLLQADVAASSFALLVGMPSPRIGSQDDKPDGMDPAELQSRCFRPGRDLVLPPLIRTTHMSPRGTSRPIILLVPSQRQSEQAKAVPASSASVSTQRLLVDLHREKGPQGWVLLQKRLLKQSAHRSSFCACPKTDQWAASLTRAILSGCIPVLFTEDLARGGLPWQGQADYSKFTITLPVEKLPNLPQLLHSTLSDKTAMESLQAELERVQHLFSYSRGDPTTKDKPSALDTLFASLKLRAASSSLQSSSSQGIAEQIPDSALQSFPSLCIPTLSTLGLQPSATMASEVLGQDVVAALQEADSSPSLSQPDVRVRLCTPRPVPFVAGTFHHKAHMCRITVFELEVLHNVVPGKPMDTQEGSDVVQILLAAESVRTIERSRTEGWGPSFHVDTQKDFPIDLRCRFWHGTTASDRSGSQPLFESDAVWAPMSEFFLLLHCPLPKEKDGGLLTSLTFQIELYVRDSATSILHLDPLPVCRSLGASSSSSRKSKGNSESGKEGKAAGVTAICLRPFHDHEFFLERIQPGSHSFDRFLEFLHYHILIGLDKVYFYDRYGQEKLGKLKPYVDQGMVEHVPFPFWSEVFYRKDMVSHALNARAFPLAYDQLLSMQHCIMQGRRNMDDWLFMIDSDEFLRYPEPKPGLLPSILAKMEASHAAENKPLSALRIHRFNFVGAEKEAKSALRSATKRCKTIAVHKWWDGPDDPVSQDKLAVRPHRMVRGFVQIHYVKNVPESEEIITDENVLAISHYSSRIGDHICRDWGSTDPEAEDPIRVEDTSMEWAPPLLDKCTSPEECSQKLGCGRLCALFQD